jgi:ABC-type microcin C transport system duplicated ATPase subunit YejF
MIDNNQPLLKVSDLVISFDTVDGSFDAVKGVSFKLSKGRNLRPLLEKVAPAKVLLRQLLWESLLVPLEE